MIMVHELKPTHRLKKKKRVGRGGKRGTYSGRGIKGQKSRAGAKIKPMEREFILRLPKKRGLGFPKAPRIIPIVTLSLEKISQYFEAGEIVSPKTLLKKGLVKKEKGRIPKVKILGPAILEKKLSFIGCTFSESARKAIEAAGGKIK